MAQLNSKIPFGMVGGGEGAFIGAVHRMAAEMDGLAQLVCGAFASEAARSVRSGVALYRLPESRCYANYAELFAKEAALPDTQRMQFVVIATPNHTHFEIASQALAAGFHVVCDKPLTLTSGQAQQLAERLQSSGLKLALTHNYTGYPMIRQARALVASGALGPIRRVSCEYLQGWLAQAQTDNKQAEWRTDPSRAGVAGCFGDIGSHAENLVSYVTGLSVASLSADLSTFVPGRQLDDDGNVLLRFVNGAKGVISASQIAVGKENDLRLQIYGEQGGLEWQQADANSLVVRWADAPSQTYRTDGVYLAQSAAAASRVPAGHPEGYLEAFAEIYRNFCLDLLGETQAGYPSIEEGIRGLKFIEAVVASSTNNGAWTAP